MSQLQKISRNDQISSYEFQHPLTYTYTSGIALEKYLKEIRDNERIVGTKCKECGLIYVPAILFCERCFEELDDYIEMFNRGIIVSYTINFEDLDENRLEKPVIIAMVQIDGAHGGIIHKMLNIENEHVKIGMPVKIVFKPKSERTGSILDIEGFSPV